MSAIHKNCQEYVKDEPCVLDVLPKFFNPFIYAICNFLFQYVICPFADEAFSITLQLRNIKCFFSKIEL